MSSSLSENGLTYSFALLMVEWCSVEPIESDVEAKLVPSLDGVSPYQRDCFIQ